MKKIILILFSLVILSSCDDPNIDNSNKTPSEYLTSNLWQLDKVTTADGKTINNSTISGEGHILFELYFDFKKSSELNGIDKVQKTRILGTWNLTDENTVLDIDIPGLKDSFEVVELGNKKMTLKASNGKLLGGLGTDVNLVFKEFTTN